MMCRAHGIMEHWVFKPFVWGCHDGHEGVIVPATYENIHGEIVRIDPKHLIRIQKSFIFDHYSIIPISHYSNRSTSRLSTDCERRELSSRSTYIG